MKVKYCIDTYGSKYDVQDERRKTVICRYQVLIYRLSQTAPGG